MCMLTSGRINSVELVVDATLLYGILKGDHELNFNS